MPISEAAKKFTQEKFKGRKFLIGLDAAVVVGNPDVITTSLIVIPLTILMAAVLPGNRVLPFADLAVVTFRVATGGCKSPEEICLRTSSWVWYVQELSCWQVRPRHRF